MALVPVNKSAKIDFFETRLPLWTTNAVAIGTTLPIVADLEAKTQAAREAWLAQETAAESARSATIACDVAIAAMAAAGGEVIAQIRIKGKSVGDSVYALANIPAPATPTAKGPPGTPSDFLAELLPDGTLSASWKCTNPPGTSGTLYQVFRRDGLSGEFNYVGGTGSRKFIDTTVPHGLTLVTYKIQAVRSTAVGIWAEFLVNFANSGTGPIVTVSQAPAAPKLAA